MPLLTGSGYSRDWKVETFRHASRRSAESSVVVLTLAFLVSLWAFFGLWAFHEQSSAHRAAGAVLQRQRMAADAQIGGVLQMAEVFIAAANRWMADHPGDDLRTSPQFLDLVLSLQRVTNSGIRVHLASESGELFLVPPEVPQQKVNVGDRDYFKAAIEARPGQVFINPPLLGRAGERWVIPVVARLRQPSHAVSVIVVALDSELFNRVFDAIRLDEESVISLLRSDGVLLALSGAQPGDLGIPLIDSPVFTQGLATAPRGIVFDPQALPDRIPRLQAFGEMSDYPLVVVVGASLKSIDAPRLRTLRVAFGLLLLVTLVVLFGSWRSLRLLGELHRRDEALQYLASTDELTGLLNRRQFLQSCDEELARARRYGQPLAFLEFDLDFFKCINDAYGHAAGDAVLQAFAEVGRQCLRDIDHFGRLGGEEFGVLLPSTDAQGALRLAERMVMAISERAVPVGEAGELILRFTSSAGLTELGADDDGFEAVFARADRALYQAKAAGRNRVQVCLPEHALSASLTGAAE